MNEITCIDEGVYEKALTRGKRYEVLSFNEEKQQVRIRGDNQRHRWFPSYFFDFENRPVPQLVLYSIDDPEDLDATTDIGMEITVKLSTGEFRWCWFFTPSALENCGNYIPGTQVRFHYHNHHVIIVNKVTYETVEKALIYIDSQNELINCTKPFD